MANALGYVTETKTGFEGALAMMNLSSPIRIEKNAEKAAEGQPDYRIFAGDTATEIGGCWLKKARGVGRDYSSSSVSSAKPRSSPREVGREGTRPVDPDLLFDAPKRRPC